MSDADATSIKTATSTQLLNQIKKSAKIKQVKEYKPV